MLGQDPYNRFNDDITFNRHGGNAESNTAYRHLLERIPQARAEVLELVSMVSPTPMIPKEIEGGLGKAIHSISGRCTELKEMGLVCPTNIIRDGSRALELEEHWYERLKTTLEAPQTPEKSIYPVEGTKPPRKIITGSEIQAIAEEFFQKKFEVGGQTSLFFVTLAKKITDKVNHEN